MSTNLLDFNELRLQGTRTVEVDVRGRTLTVTERLEDDSSIERELGRARMVAQRGTRAAQTVMALGDGADKTKDEEELARATEAMDSLDVMVTFDPRRIVCRRICERFVEWNLTGPDGGIPLDFDGLYDGPVSTPILEAIVAAVRNEPIVGE